MMKNGATKISAVAIGELQMHQTGEEKKRRCDPQHTAKKMRDGPIGAQGAEATHGECDGNGDRQGNDIAYEKDLKWRIG